MLAARRWSAAYYVAGYAVECALKSCVLKRLAGGPEVIFENKRFSENCWTHNLEDLVTLAGLDAALAADVAANRVLGRYWMTVKDWNEKSRYATTPHHLAKQLYKAITESTNGVMQWIKVRW